MHALTEAPIPLVFERLSGARLKGALIAGAGRVLSKRDDLNRINVFPVPDGDTGTNLAFTMLAVVKSVRRLRGADVGTVIGRVAREAIDGARGNSGAILAQFFQGLSESLGRCHEADAGELAEAASCAARSARSCLAEPREGTMLSVISDFASEMRGQVESGVADLAELFRHSLVRARQSLANTPNQLPVLRAAGVVDAGAAGFVDFLEGVQDFIERGRSALRVAPEARDAARCEHDEVHLEAVESASIYRYCTECVLTGNGLDLASVRTTLAALALDSLVVAGGSERVRVHAHIDRPNQLFETLSGLASVTQRKADDMQAQARLRASPFQRVRIVTDSAGDVPASEAERLGITIVPVRINFGDDDYLDRITMAPRELYARLRAEATAARTSQPPPGDFRRAFDLVLAHCEQLVSVELSSRLSGTFQAAQTAAKDSGRERIAVVDTGHAASGQGLIAMAAAEVALTGADAATVIAATQAAMGRTRTFALVRDLSYGVRGGRMPAIAEKIARWFGLTVLICDKQGLVRPFSALFGRKRLVERFAATVAQRIPAQATCRAVVGHCDASEDAASLAAALRTALPQLGKIWVVETGPAIGVHAGPGSLVVGVQWT
jgi:DegV family protein with EDD domain